MLSVAAAQEVHQLTLLLVCVCENSAELLEVTAPAIALLPCAGISHQVGPATTISILQVRRWRLLAGG